MNVRPIIIPKKVIFKKGESEQEKLFEVNKFFLVWVNSTFSREATEEEGGVIQRRMKNMYKIYKTESWTENFSTQIYIF